MVSLALSHMVDSENRGEQSQYQLPSAKRDIGLKQFLVFPMLIFPMTREEAVQCLPQFVESVAKAIHSMHQEPLQRAHLDIRLENVCFRALGTAYRAIVS